MVAGGSSNLRITTFPRLFADQGVNVLLSLRRDSEIEFPALVRLSGDEDQTMITFSAGVEAVPTLVDFTLSGNRVSILVEPAPLAINVFRSFKLVFTPPRLALSGEDDVVRVDLALEGGSLASTERLVVELRYTTELFIGGKAPVASTNFVVTFAGGGVLPQIESVDTDAADPLGGRSDRDTGRVGGRFRRFATPGVLS